MADTNNKDLLQSIGVSAEALTRSFQLGVMASVPTLATDDAVPYIVIPNDAKIVSLEHQVFHGYREFPFRKQAQVKLDDAGSFIKYFTDHCEEDSAIFASKEKQTITGIIDYHGRGPEKKPRWKQHQVHMTVKRTSEWSTWLTQSGTKFGQEEFAEFVEDNAPDFVTPTAADMLELATTMKASSEANMESAVRLTNGTFKFAWNEVVSGKFGAHETECPEWFTIRIAIYEGMTPQEIRCRMRFRLANKQLRIWYDILRAEAIERVAFQGFLNEIGQATGQTILMGCV